MDIEQIPVSDELLALMREAATKTLAAGEPFITPRALLIALLRDPILAEPLSEAIDVEALEAFTPPAVDLPGVMEVPDEPMPDDEKPALVRYDTLAFKDESGRRTVWLNGDAHKVFLEGARRAEDRYVPKHLALAFVSEARRQPQLLGDLKVDTGKLAEVAFKL